MAYASKGALNGFCEWCGKWIANYGLIQPAVCPHPKCLRPTPYGERVRRIDGIMRCFGCFAITHVSFKYCAKCGKSITTDDISRLAKCLENSKTNNLSKPEMVDACEGTDDMQEDMEFSAIVGEWEEDDIMCDKEGNTEQAVADGDCTAQSGGAKDISALSVSGQDNVSSRKNLNVRSFGGKKPVGRPKKRHCKKTKKQS